MNKKKLIISLLCVLLVLTISVGVFCYFHPTHYQFNDRFVIGSTYEQIVEKYGEFSQTRQNSNGQITFGSYMIHDDTPEMIMGYDNSLWYEITFQDGIATEVRLQKGRYGG